jgi:cob(I)alamin adenosyltransferase
MKIYTRTGDGGQTGLFGGGRVAKDDLRVRAYGDVDEANAAIGAARALTGPEHADLSALLARVQDQLFTLGAELATPHGTKARSAVPRIDPSWTAALETAMDGMETELPPLTQFVLPGGSPLAAALHLARCVCRRAEREVVALSRVAELDAALMPYLNRLSDYLFVAARLANRRSHVDEILWTPPRPA